MEYLLHSTIDLDKDVEPCVSTISFEELCTGTVTWKSRGVCVFLANTVHGRLCNRSPSGFSITFDVTRNIRTITTPSQGLHIIKN